MAKRSSAHKAAQKAGRLRDRNVCQICGSTVDVEGHHIIDYQFGGAASKDNIVTLYHKHNRDVHDGRISIFKM